MDFIIRDEEPRDHEQVRAILQATFPSHAESRLVDALRTSGKAVISLVAVAGDQVLSRILFSPVSTTPPNNAKRIGLAPVAVWQEVQSQGIGSDLLRDGLRCCQDLEYDYCVVLGNPKYYQRFGFERASDLDLQNEYGVDNEFMVIRFSKAELGRGLVKYAPEFGWFSV